jgi:aspartyl-tRNA(Asn)/glutamyl-tRNA(Gln) amidotransferase subunit A
MLEFGARQSAIRVAGVYRRLAEARACLQTLLESVDLLLMPTVPQPSFRHGEPVPVNQADFTALANILGAPALAVPWGQSPDGLPLSMQIVAPPGGEAQVLHLGAVLEGIACGGLPSGVTQA